MFTWLLLRTPNGANRSESSGKRASLFGDAGSSPEITEQPAGQVAERREAPVRAAADTEAVVDVHERHAALAGRRLISGRVADEHRAAEPVACDQQGEVLGLGAAGVA